MKPGLLVTAAYDEQSSRVQAFRHPRSSGISRSHSIPSTHVDKVGEGPYDPARLTEEGRIDLVINTPAGGRARGDGRIIRLAATRHGIPCFTTAEGGLAAARSIKATQTEDIRVASIQHIHAAAGL